MLSFLGQTITFNLPNGSVIALSPTQVRYNGNLVIDCLDINVQQRMSFSIPLGDDNVTLKVLSIADFYSVVMYVDRLSSRNISMVVDSNQSRMGELYTRMTEVCNHWLDERINIK